MTNRRSIYLDYQASTPVDERVLQVMEPFYRDCFANPHSADHSLGWQAARAIEQAAEEAAGLIGGAADEIVFTSGATEANNQALLGAVQSARRGNRKRILVSAIEHKCVLAAATAAVALYGCTVEQIPVDPQGRIDIDRLRYLLDDEVLLVSIMAVNNEIGTIQALASIAQLTRNVGALLHSDCAQAPLAVDMKKIAEVVDMASLSAHKMYGPKGIGVLFIERSVQKRIQPLIHGGGQQQNLRSGTVPVPLVVGMGKAAQLLGKADVVSERKRLEGLRDRLVSRLQKRGIQIVMNTPIAVDVHPANANIRFVGLNAQDILQSVQPFVAASTGSACTSGIPGPSHVLRAIGLSDVEAEGCIRFSVGRFSTEEDIDQAVVILADAIGQLSQI
jgi:cysteine desulfurase